MDPSQTKNAVPAVELPSVPSTSHDQSRPQTEAGIAPWTTNDAKAKTTDTGNADEQNGAGSQDSHFPLPPPSLQHMIPPVKPEGAEQDDGQGSENGSSKYRRSQKDKNGASNAAADATPFYAPSIPKKKSSVVKVSIKPKEFVIGERMDRRGMTRGGGGGMSEDGDGFRLEFPVRKRNGKYAEVPHLLDGFFMVFMLEPLSL
jgi:hypothetical protein